MTQRLTMPQLKETMERGRRVYKPGDVFIHIKSHAYYEIVGIALSSDDVTPQVLYSPIDETDVVWSRSSREFSAKFKRVQPG